MTQVFEKLKAACEEPEKTKAHWRDWVSDSMWAMIKQRTLLSQAGQLRRAEGQRMQRAIHAALKTDRAAHTAQVGKLIVTELAEGNVHVAFRHMKGWYRNASETQAKPCFHTMELQTQERIKLYWRCDSPGPPIIINNAEMLTKEIQDDTPTDREIRVAVAEFTNGRSAGVS